jgi:hypothetical protein
MGHKSRRGSAAGHAANFPRFKIGGLIGTNFFTREGTRSPVVSERVGIETENPRQSGAEWSDWGGIEVAVTRAQLCFNIPNGVILGTGNPRQFGALHVDFSDSKFERPNRSSRFNIPYRVPFGTPARPSRWASSSAWGS